MTTPEGAPTATFGEFMRRHGLFTTETDESATSRKCWAVDPDDALRRDLAASVRYGIRVPPGRRIKPGIEAWDMAALDPGVADLGVVAGRERIVAFADVLVSMVLNHGRTTVHARIVREARADDGRLTARDVIEGEEGDTVLPLTRSGTTKAPRRRRTCDVATPAEIQGMMEDVVLMAHVEHPGTTRARAALESACDHPGSLHKRPCWMGLERRDDAGRDERKGDRTLSRIVAALDLRGRTMLRWSRTPWRASALGPVNDRFTAETPSSGSSVLKAAWRSRVAGDGGAARRRIEAFADLVEARRAALRAKAAREGKGA